MPDDISHDILFNQENVFKVCHSLHIEKQSYMKLDLHLF